jgi:DNA-binding NarL/FixJ family response regulator
MLTVYDDDEYVLEAIKAGAMGYLLKDLDAASLVSAVRRVATGESLIDQDVATRLLQDMARKTAPGSSGAALLTDREREILEAIASGLANKEIADKLTISERTVKNHITNIFKKIDVHDRTQAALFAIREGLAKL